MALLAVFLLQGFVTTFESRSLSEAELRRLAKDLAPKVTLFHDIWQHDPSAALYGGTSRDFLYWIMGQFRGLSNDEAFERKFEELRKMKAIDIKDIVGPESDIDVISDQAIGLEIEAYGIRKLDLIETSRFDRTTVYGRNEFDQGWIPLEKIRLTQNGLSCPAEFGNPIEEMLTGNLTVHFTDPEVFWDTPYAQNYENHHVILAIRYLRIRALHWYKTKGAEYPDEEELLNFDPAIKAKLASVFNEALTDKRFKKLLKTKRGNRWINAAVLKAFRSHTNPTAAYLLFSHFGYKELQEKFPRALNSINQFLFRQYRRQDEIDSKLKEFKVKPAALYSSVNRVIPGRVLLHGTKEEEAFRAILFQNVLPSKEGAVGRGLYAVPLSEKSFAIGWGGDKNRVVQFKVSERAKIIDLTSAKGRDLFERWARKYGGNKVLDAAGNLTHSQEDFDRFASDFGADILKYPFQESENAVVVKNSEVLEEPEGFYRKLLSITSARVMAKKVSRLSDFIDLMKLLHFNIFSSAEKEAVLEEVGSKKLLKFIRDLKFSKPFTLTDYAPMIGNIQGPERLELAKQYLLKIPELKSGIWLGRNVHGEIIIHEDADREPYYLITSFFSQSLNLQEREALANFLVSQGRHLWVLFDLLFLSQKELFSDQAQLDLLKQLMKYKFPANRLIGAVGASQSDEHAYNRLDSRAYNLAYELFKEVRTHHKKEFRQMFRSGSILRDDQWRPLWRQRPEFEQWMNEFLDFERDGEFVHDRMLQASGLGETTEGPSDMPYAVRLFESILDRKAYWFKTFKAIVTNDIYSPKLFSWVLEQITNPLSFSWDGKSMFTYPTDYQIDSLAGALRYLTKHMTSGSEGKIQEAVALLLRRIQMIYGHTGKTNYAEQTITWELSKIGVGKINISNLARLGRLDLEACQEWIGKLASDSSSSAK